MGTPHRPREASPALRPTAPEGKDASRWRPGQDLVDDPAESRGEDEVEDVGLVGEELEGPPAKRGHELFRLVPAQPLLSQHRTRQVDSRAQLTNATPLFGQGGRIRLVVLRHRC